MKYDQTIQLYPNYGQFQSQRIVCRCGWRGIGRQAERGRAFDTGVEVSCPACATRFGVAIYPAAPREAKPPRLRVGTPPALARMLDLIESFSDDDHERAYLLLCSGLPLTRENWIGAYFAGHDAGRFPAEFEAHLPSAFSRG